MLMLLYLPAIVQKRADIRLHVHYGGTIKHEDHEETVLTPAEDLDAWVARTANIAPSEDLYIYISVTVKQIYTNEGTVRGINKLIQVWKERILMGLRQDRC